MTVLTVLQKILIFFAVFVAVCLVSYIVRKISGRK